MSSLHGSVLVMQLSAEQLAQIEANRQAALARQAARKIIEPDVVLGKRSFESQMPKNLNEKAPAAVDYSALIDTFSVQLSSPTTFSCRNVRQLAAYCKSFPLARYCESEKTWHFPLAEYDKFVKGLPFKPKPSNLISKNILSLFSQPTKAPDPLSISLDRLDPVLGSALLPFQQEGAAQAIHWNGRILLADDMGLGKSLQALAIISYYRIEWPCLIIAPSSMIASWHEQVLRWIPSVDPADIAVIYDGKGRLEGLVNIASFDMIVRMSSGRNSAIPKFRVIVVDECHALKNSTTKRSQTIVPMCQAADRAILLSGTPALSRPVELFPQINAVAPWLFGGGGSLKNQNNSSGAFFEFGIRYCAGRQGSFGWDWRGASHLTELQVILERTILVRRVKEQVLKQLPRKIRQQVFLSVPTATLRSLERQRMAIDQQPQQHSFEQDLLNPRAELMDLWRRTAEAKLPAMLEYMEDLLETAPKILLFAHHRSILDAFAAWLGEHRINQIRIDGQTAPCDRQALCSRFQGDPGVRVALLSITAASTGLTLTAASTVVFAELFWNPGVLIQAEDRAHRIGQNDSVVVHYLLAKGTSDDTVWPLILRKLSTLEGVGLGKNDFGNVQRIEHDSNQLKLAF